MKDPRYMSMTQKYFTAMKFATTVKFIGKYFFRPVQYATEFNVL